MACRLCDVNLKWQNTKWLASMPDSMYYQFLYRLKPVVGARGHCARAGRRGDRTSSRSSRLFINTVILASSGGQYHATIVIVCHPLQNGAPGAQYVYGVWRLLVCMSSMSCVTGYLMAIDIAYLSPNTLYSCVNVCAVTSSGAYGWYCSWLCLIVLRTKTSADRRPASRARG